MIKKLLELKDNEFVKKLLFLAVFIPSFIFFGKYVDATKREAKWKQENLVRKSINFDIVKRTKQNLLYSTCLKNKELGISIPNVGYFSKDTKFEALVVEVDQDSCVHKILVNDKELIVGRDESLCLGKKVRVYSSSKEGLLIPVDECI